MGFRRVLLATEDEWVVPAGCPLKTISYASEVGTMVDSAELQSAAFRYTSSGGKVQRLVLTGFMGAGKSTVGQLCADRTGWDFLDLDRQIESITGKCARELFESLGESGFRELETTHWASVLQRSRAIIAPGGAVIDRLENQRILAESVDTFVIFLDGPFQMLMGRCLQQEQHRAATFRPLLHKTELAHSRYSARRVLYARHAHQVINVADKTPDVVAQEVWQSISAVP